MKFQLLTLALVALTTFGAATARTHNLKTHGIATTLELIHGSTANKKSLHPLITKYHARVQKGEYAIEAKELDALLEEVTKITSKNSKYQL